MTKNQQIIILDQDYYEAKAVDRKLTEKYVNPSTLFCDVGGGCGTDAFNFLEKGAEGICVDLWLDSLKKGTGIAKQTKLNSKLSFVMASATNLPFSTNKFDITTSFSVIDHIPPKEAAYKSIKEFARVTKKGGYVVVTVPNKLFLVGTVLMGIKMRLQRDTFFEQRFTPKELAQSCADAGLEIIEYDSKYPLIIGKSLMMGNIPKIMLKIPLRLLLPLFKLGTMTFGVMEKKLGLRLLGARYGFTAVKI